MDMMVRINVRQLNAVGLKKMDLGIQFIKAGLQQGRAGPEGAKVAEEQAISIDKTCSLKAKYAGEGSELCEIEMDTEAGSRKLPGHRDGFIDAGPIGHQRGTADSSHAQGMLNRFVHLTGIAKIIRIDHYSGKIRRHW